MKVLSLVVARILVVPDDFIGKVIYACLRGGSATADVLTFIEDVTFPAHVRLTFIGVLTQDNLSLVRAVENCFFYVTLFQKSQPFLVA